jgi:NAD(P)-dependent dehydrogenase (short-subunit alcohol dehydrogenase family)
VAKGGTVKLNEILTRRELSQMALDSSTRNAETSAIVTGGGQGVGFAIAEQLAAEGCRKLALIGRTPEKLENAAAGLQAMGATVVTIAADVSEAEACERAVREAIARLGHVNALVNAAATSARGSLVETTPELFDTIFASNVRGPFFLMQGLVRHLLEVGRPGSIVNILSMSGHGGQDFLTAYSTSKGAMNTLTRNVAMAYRKQHIRCNAILPGWMDTPGEDAVQKKWHGASDDWLQEAEASQPFGQLVKPAQLAVLAAYMLSPQSGVMTGALVDYDQNVIGAALEQD